MYSWKSCNEEKKYRYIDGCKVMKFLQYSIFIYLMCYFDFQVLRRHERGLDMYGAHNFQFTKKCNKKVKRGKWIMWEEDAYLVADLLIIYSAFKKRVKWTLEQANFFFLRKPELVKKHICWLPYSCYCLIYQNILVIAVM